MKCSPRLLTYSLISAAALTLTACGGGGGLSPSASSAVSTTVMDGLIQNALVCLDTNKDGICNTGEPQGRTDANGRVTLQVPTADIGTATLVAMIGTDATDIDNGKITTAYTLTTPAGRLDVISPLTTMVQTKIDQDKVSADVAAAFVQSQIGLTVSVFDNFIALRDSSAGHKKAGEVARILALTVQKSKEGRSSDASCMTGLTDKDAAEHAAESEIRNALVNSLPDVRKTSDATENQSDAAVQKSVATLPVCPTPTPTPTPPADASADNGKLLYAASCSSCHGSDPLSGRNNILRGANRPSTILHAIADNEGGMGVLTSVIATTQANDIAAYLANPSGAPTPT
ncbi:MAG: c-type cytochrome, partial [Rhodoferax sp.]